jgi:hypothetical protein
MFFPFFVRIIAEPFTFDSKYSTFRVANGATFSVNSPMTNYTGTLVKDAAATINAGSYISFVDGIFEDSGNQLRMTSVLNTAGNQLSLTGNGKIRAQPGTILQNFSNITGSNNRIEGQPRFSNALTLASGAALTLAVQSTMNQDIVLTNNTSTLTLESDLRFADGKKITGSGTINGNGCAVITGNQSYVWDQSVTLTWQTGSQLDLLSSVTLLGALTFQGNCAINGQGNVLDLSVSPYGKIFIGPGANLSLSDITIRGVRNTSFVFGDATATLSLTGAVFFENADDVTLSQGNVLIAADSVWAIQDKSWIFSGTSLLRVNGFTLWLEQAGAANIGSVIGNISLINNGAILVSASGNTALMQNEITALQGWVYTSQRAIRRSPPCRGGR